MDITNQIIGFLPLVGFILITMGWTPYLILKIGKKK